MIPLVLCVSNSHDPRLVGLALLICTLGVYATFAIGKQATRCKGRERKLWSCVSIVSVGGPTWATPFILLLAYRPGVPAGFDPVLTLLSLLSGVVVIGAGQIVLLSARRKALRVCGGAVLGAGVGALHYLGMAAYQVQGLVRWNLPLVFWTVTLGIAMSGAAGLLAGLRDRAWRGAAAPLILLSVGVLHFGGMGADTIYFDPSRTLPASALSPSVLAPVMAAIALCALGLASLGFHFELAARRRRWLKDERLRELADVALEGLLICHGGKIVAANKSLERLYGASRSGLTGCLVNGLFKDVDLFSVAEDEEHAAELLAAGGQTVPVCVLRRGVTSKGRDQTVVAVRGQRERLRTEAEREALLDELRQALKDAQAANEAKSQFLANMSHEIRTPLNGVLGMSQAIAADELSPLQRERLDVVVRSGQSLLRILNDILDFSKIEAGRVDLETVAFDFSTVLGDAVMTFRTQAEAKGLRFACHDDEGLEGPFAGDPGRIRQILFNLLSNAVKFTAIGSVEITATMAADDRVQVAIADTGEGISAEALPRLFQTFTQADASTTRRHGGAGLGLAVSRQLAQLMGGDITAVSTAGAGSIFTLELPLRRLEAVQPTIDLQQSAPLEISDTLRILAADDNATNQIVLRTLLGQVGAELTIVDDGLQALEAWRVNTYDLILMDIQMPRMDGVTAVRHIRAEEASAGRARTPILALTANVMHHQLDEYRAAGMDGHVGKPIDTASMFCALDEALRADGRRAAA